MWINIRGKSFKLTYAIQRHVEGRIQLALGTASEWIDSVSVRLADINAGRGGTDKRCRLVVQLRGVRDVVVEAVHADLYAATDEVAYRAKEAVWRLLKRRRTLKREFANRPAKRLRA